MRTFLDAKLMAKALRQGLAERDLILSHSDCLELVAKQFGFSEWNMLAARLREVTPEDEMLKLPKDWGISGPTLNGTTHRLGLDPSVPGSALIETIFKRNKQPALHDKIAVLMQSVNASPFTGRHVRLTARLKTEDADCGTIWLRVDSSHRMGLRFDNMLSWSFDGPLSGTHDWTERTIVLEVPNEAASIHYGFLLKGYGKVWAQSFDLSRAERDLTPTAIHSQYLERPSNLDFSQVA